MPTQPTDFTPIDGGFCVKRIDATHCLDIMAMAFNWRLVVTRRRPTDDSPHMIMDAGWCYFGHGTNDAGEPRTMRSALLAVTAAALAWDGVGEPPGYDKQAFGPRLGEGQ